MTWKEWVIKMTTNIGKENKVLLRLPASSFRIGEKDGEKVLFFTGNQYEEGELVIEQGSGKKKKYVAIPSGDV